MSFGIRLTAVVLTGFSSLSFARPTPDWHAQIVNAPKAWATGITGKGVVVAVIDSGLDLKDAHLKNRFFKNVGETGVDKGGHDKSSNEIDDDSNGFIDDVHGWNFVNNTNDTQDDTGHGTGLSSLIVNSGAVTGIAPDATILPLKFLNPDGSGNIVDAVRAMAYADQMGAKVLLLSWGSATDLHAMEAKISELDKKGVLMIAAAGNDGADLGVSPEFPAAYTFNSLLTVGSTTSTDFVSLYSNYGSAVQLGAPGDNLLVQGLTRPQKMSGTPFSAAIVAGAAALVLEKYPSLKASEVKAQLLKTAAKLQGPTSLNGRVDAFAAVSSLEGI